jgi:predicted metal-binding membrane protein
VQSATTGSAVRVDIARAAPYLIVLLIASSFAWLWTFDQARSMGNMPGTMGMSVAAFLVMWGFMMTAMMLPSAAPTAALYSRTIVSDRYRRLGAFAAGYLLVWTATGVPAYVLAWLADVAVGRSLGIALAAGIFVANGAYQLTPLKYACLSHCRTPMGSVFEYASWHGRLRDLRVGLHHGAYFF